ncbi:single-stranded DNA-binding protein [Candidatus Saccharibacteria bacterium]|nr:single-stranded DNA-binding protein [Candidatus Saccharibacteria bacterium]
MPDPEHVNRVELVGILDSEVAVEHTGEGLLWASFKVHTIIPIIGRLGKKIRAHAWHRISAYQDAAERVRDWQQGSMVRVAGYLRTRSWMDQGGRKQYRTEVVASDVELLSPPQYVKADEELLPEETPPWEE